MEKKTRINKERRRQRSHSRNCGVNDSHRSSNKGSGNADKRRRAHALAIRVNMHAAREGHVLELVATFAYKAHVKALTVSAVLCVARDAPSDVAVVATLA